METFRTPDERFANLPGFPYAPQYREWEGLRLAHVDEGQGPPVLMLHGEPTWSFLYRKVMEPLLEAGFRCVAPDLPGFGRSDKPTDDSWYSYARHTEAVTSLIEELDLREVTLVVQDWGGPIGFRAATIEPTADRIARVVAMDTGVFTGHQQMSEGWHRFRDFVVRTPDVPIELLIKNACATDVPDEVLAAYAAPFPDQRSKAGPRTFPPMIPLEPDAPGAAEGQQVARALSNDSRPMRVLWADSDPAIPLDPVGRLMADFLPTADGLTVIENAGHFLQEDQGERIGRLTVEWLGELGVRGA